MSKGKIKNKINLFMRNLTILAHVDAGKTTTTERALAICGRISKDKMGEVHDGEATTDFDPQEMARGITINSAAVFGEFRISPHYSDGDTLCGLNLIDSPGHVDFVVEVEKAAHSSDNCLLLICASSGCQAQTRNVMEIARRTDNMICIFVNKIDRQGADFEKCMLQINTVLGLNPVALYLPVGVEDNFRGLLDLIAMKYIKFDPKNLDFDVLDFEDDAMKAAAVEGRQRMCEQVCMHSEDDELLNKFMTEGDIETELLQEKIAILARDNKITLVIPGAAYRNKGVQQVLDTIARFGRPPNYRRTLQVTDMNNDNALVPFETNDSNLLVRVFKIVKDIGVFLCFVRVFSGVLRRKTTFINARTGKKSKVTKMFRVFANKKEPIDELTAGSVGAISCENIATGDTLCDVGARFALGDINVPPQVIQKRLIPRTSKDAANLRDTLHVMQIEDPSFSVVYLDDGSILLCGCGILHLEVKIFSLKQVGQFNVGAPVVKYREAFDFRSFKDEKLELKHRHKKQSGGSGEFGEISFVVMKADEEGVDLQFQDATKGDNIPKEFFPAIKKGMELGMQRGPIIGAPIGDMKVVIVDGQSHPVDSSTQAFKNCGLGAMVNIKRDHARHFFILEPIMKVCVTTLESYFGDISGDISRRKGIITDSEYDEGHGTYEIVAEMPLRNLDNYIEFLRGATKGSATFTASFNHYARVPTESVETVIKSVRPS
jgi:elongation factor G